jgi:methylamine--corrinoid protein Co-methyltransferase
MVRARIWNLLKRAETGSICSEQEFTLKKYWPRVKELQKEYDIKYDSEHIVPTDDTLLDDVFRAGLNLLLDVGVMCVDTNRVIKFEESEIREIFRNLPKEGTLGEGKDAVTLQHHELEDVRPSIVIGGAGSIPISEEMAIKIYQSYAMEPVVDIVFLGAPATIEGATVRSGSPLELHAEICNIAWARTATRKAGRPGMPIYGSVFPSVVTDLGASSPEYGYRKTDLRCLWPLPELKVDYPTLCRVVHFMEYGCHASTCGDGNIGGISGGLETSLITAVAECLATQVLFQPLINWAGILNIVACPPWIAETDIKSMWGTFLATAAINKNTNMILFAGCYTYAGPCTEMCLRETAAVTIGGTSVGGHAYLPAPNSGMVLDHCTGMESRFRGEVAHAAAGIKREDANEMVKVIETKYGDIIKTKNIPFGKKFEECYDSDTITPSKEYMEIYSKVRKELEDLGLEFGY